MSSATRPRGAGGEEDGTGSGGAGTVRGRGDRGRGGDRLRDRAGGGTHGVFAGFAGAGCGAGGGGVSGAPVRTFAALVAARSTFGSLASVSSFAIVAMASASSSAAVLAAGAGAATGSAAALASTAARRALRAARSAAAAAACSERFALGRGAGGPGDQAPAPAEEGLQVLLLLAAQGLAGHLRRSGSGAAGRLRRGHGGSGSAPARRPAPLARERRAPAPARRRRAERGIGRTLGTAAGSGSPEAAGIPGARRGPRARADERRRRHGRHVLGRRLRRRRLPRYSRAGRRGRRRDEAARASVFLVSRKPVFHDDVVVVFFGESGCRGFGAGIAGAFSSTSLMTAFSTGGATRTPSKWSYATVVPSGAVIGATAAQCRALLLKFQESVFRALEASFRELLALARRRARVVGAGVARRRPCKLSTAFSARFLLLYPNCNLQ